MRHIPVFILLLATLASDVLSQERYTNKYDNVDVDEILQNERLLKKFVECLLAENDRRCTAEGKELRRHIPDALTTNCSKCTDKQKAGAEKVLKFLRENKAEDYDKLLSKWDPQGHYRRRYL